MCCSFGDEVLKSKSSFLTENSTLLWARNKPPPDPTRYNLTSFAITLNEITSDLKVDMACELLTFTFSDLLVSSFTFVLNSEYWSSIKGKLPPTDSRLRPDQRYLENGEYEKANSEKLRLERRQRMVILSCHNSFKLESHEQGFLFLDLLIILRGNMLVTSYDILSSYARKFLLPHSL